MRKTTTWDQTAFNKRLAAIAPALRAMIKEQNEKSARRTVKRVKARINNVSGDLADSVHQRPGKTELAVEVVMGGGEVDYAAAHEFGRENADGSRTPASPTFIPIVREEKRKHRRAVVRGAKKTYRDLGKRGKL